MKIYIRLILLMLFFLFLNSCVSDDNPVELISESYPDWYYNPPKEEGYFFGIGAAMDLIEAKQKSMVNISQQFSTRVISILEEQSIINSEGKGTTVVDSFNQQLSDQVIYGAKFMEQYQDESGTYWILTRAPLSCMLDVTEGVLMNYRLDILEDRKDIFTIVESIETEINEVEEYFYIAPDGRTAETAIPLPFRTISMKKENFESDWEGLEPIYVDNTSREFIGERANHYTKFYMCRDDDRLYWRFEFPENNPLTDISITGDDSISCAIFLYYDVREWYTLGVDHDMSLGGINARIGRYNGNWSLVSESAVTYRVYEHYVDASIKISALRNLKGNVHKMQLFLSWLKKSGAQKDASSTRNFYVKF